MAFPHAGVYGPTVVLDQNGKLAPGVSVNVYNYDSTAPLAPTTLASLYTDWTMATAATNPATTDNLGNLIFYAQPGQYTLETTLNGVTSYTQVVVEPWSADLVADDTTQKTLLQSLQVIGMGAPLVGSVPAGALSKGQFASVTGVTNSSGQFAVTFPVAFPNAVVTIVPAIGDVGSAIGALVVASSVSLTGFTIEIFNTSTGGVVGSGGTYRVNYSAVGA